MNPFVRSLLAWAKEMAQAFTQHRLSLNSGGVAFFVALALAPTFFAFGAIASLFLTRQDLESFLQNSFRQTPKEVSDALVPGLTQIATQGSSAALTTSSVVAVFVAVYAASKVVIGMRLAVDSIFNVEHEPSGLMSRAIAGLVAFLGLIAFAVTAVSLTVLPRILHALNLSPLPGIAHILTWFIGILVLYVALRAFYRFGPHFRPGTAINVPWFSWPVVFATTWIVLLTASFSFYVNFSGSLGAAVALFGASIIFLVWLYFLVLGVLLGAQMLALSVHPANAGAQQSKP